LGAHEVPVLQTRLETLQSKGAFGICLGPPHPQGSEGVCILDGILKKVLSRPLVELQGVDIWDCLLLDEVIDRVEHGTLLSGAVQLGLGRDLDRLNPTRISHTCTLTKGGARGTRG